MTNVIIGTAGHVDHGKTSLIKALTGTDTDRLKAEKERGITIELGFAFFTLENGEKCGIIDVPGHEKFVRSMLAGAGSVDLALFVVAADEGMMPQSKEHLEILSLLKIKRGIIAVTKTDLAEQEWLDMVVSDIKESVKGTFLEQAEIIPVSVRTGEGVDLLKKRLSLAVLQGTETKDEDEWGKNRDNAPFRLPIDRVFSMDGFGTVVTGTLTEGRISVGEELMIYPPMIRARVRGLQVHAQSVAEAKRGQRVAVNLSGVKTDEIQRGCCLSLPSVMQNSEILEVRLDAVKDTKRIIIDNSRLHFYHGTSDVTCRVKLIGRDELTAGESCFARFFMETPVALRAGDRFVVRFYSPAETVGGGVVLDANPPKKQKREMGADKPKTDEILKIKEKGDLTEKIAAFILDRSADFPLISGLKINPFNNSERFDAAVCALAEKKEIFLIKDCAIHKDYLDALSKKCRAVLQAFHAENPLIEGMKKEELRSKLLSKAAMPHFDGVLTLLQQENTVKLSGNIVSDVDFRVILSDSQKKMSDSIEKIFLDGGFCTPSLDEAAAKYVKEQKAFKQTVDSLVAGDVLIMLTPQIVVHKDFYNKALAIVKGFGTDTEFSLAQFRDEIQSSRKYAVALLEHFDNKGITKKRGDFRLTV